MQALLVNGEAFDLVAGGCYGCGHGGDFSMGFWVSPQPLGGSDKVCRAHTK